MRRQGETYLTFIEEAGRNTKGRLLWKCRCICGAEKVFDAVNVKCKNSRSCGCMKNSLIGKQNTKHGLKKHPLYSVWNNMKRRCYEEKNEAYPDYGARGVIMCKEWVDNFQVFYDWAMANGWNKGLEVDKDIKGTGFLYSPEMCLIVTRKENSNKRRNNTFLEFDGKKMTISQWSEYLGVNKFVISGRIQRGLSISECLSTDGQLGKRVLCINDNKVYRSITDAATKTSIGRWDISRVCSGKKDNINGYIFKYLN